MLKQAQILVQVVTDGTANCIIDLLRDPILTVWQPSAINPVQYTNWLATRPIDVTAVQLLVNGGSAGPVESASVSRDVLTVTLTPAQVNNNPTGTSAQILATLNF